MKWLCDNKIQLNICPTSNILLSRVENYKVHPIRKLYDNGIRVTVNTDDMIIFDQSVSEEFLNLYNSGIFNAVELNEIRENGLLGRFNI
jgi:adenosine deaminase